MTRYHDVDRRMEALADIRHIMSSMKVLALMETRKLGRSALAQQRVVASIDVMAADFLAFYPEIPDPPAGAPHVYMLIGSERGFCGDFNESLLQALQKRLQEDACAGPVLLAVGRRLCLKLEHDSRVETSLAGPDVTEAVRPALEEIVEQLGAIQAAHGPFYLTVLHHSPESGEILATGVLPPFQRTAPSRSPSHAPLLNLRPHTLLIELIDQYLFAALNAILYGSLIAENRRRIQHLEGAVRRLERRITEMQLQRNTLRQEEITEEIEVILLSAGTFDRESEPPGTNPPQGVP